MDREQTEPRLTRIMNHEDTKMVDRIVPVHQAQLLTYLKLTGHRVGLLVNFDVPVIKDGIKGIVL
jgi:GxxExxY protein